MTEFLKEAVTILLFVAVTIGHPIKPEATNSFSNIVKANKGLNAIYEGDIFITNEQKDIPDDVQSAVQKSDDYKWPNNIVPYMISSAFPENEKRLIKNAIRDIEAVTCIRYKEHFSAPSDKSYLHIKDDSGCWSYVGRVFYDPGEEQPLSIRRGSCTYKDIIIHELVHALGVWHEQSRPDRDDYITIHPENMYPGTEGNFEKKKNTWDRNSPYDPESIMHYDNYAFTDNDKMTITWNANKNRMLGGKVLSPSDIYQINSYYKCGPTTGPTDSTKSTTKSTTPYTTKPSTTKTTTTTRTHPTTTKTTRTKTNPTKTTKTTTKTKTTPKPSTTTTTTTTTETPITGCGDTNFLKCVRAYYNPSRFCSRSTYQDDCQQSCGLCDGVDEIQCMKFKDDPEVDCYQKSMDGHCTINNYSIRKNMKMSCSKTCCKQGRLYY